MQQYQEVKPTVSIEEATLLTVARMISFQFYRQFSINVFKFKREVVEQVNGRMNFVHQFISFLS